MTAAQQQLLRNFLDSTIGNDYAEDLSHLSSLNLDVEAEDWPGVQINASCISCTVFDMHFLLEDDEASAAPESSPPCFCLKHEDLFLQ